MKKVRYKTMILLLLPGLFGCNAFQADEGQNRQDENPIQNVGYNQDDVGIRDVQNDNNDFVLNNDNENRMEVADKAAKRITELMK